MNKLLLTLAVAGVLLAPAVNAGEKTVMHCSMFVEDPAMTTADQVAFLKATDELPKKIQGLSRIWHGPLLKPMIVDSHKFVVGLCMETSGKTLLAIEKDPAYKAWNELFMKVRAEGSVSTFDMIGQ